MMSASSLERLFASANFSAASAPSISNEAFLLSKAGSSYYDLVTGQPYNPGNPFFNGPSYTLTAPDHTQYQLDAQGNVIGEISPSGAQLYESDSGITAANGQAIQFLRNSQGLNAGTSSISGSK